MSARTKEDLQYLAEQWAHHAYLRSAASVVYNNATVEEALAQCIFYIWALENWE